MSDLKRQTTGGAVGDRLRADIEKGRLSPGARLDEAGLADRFGVSRTPVREAILALEREGLLERRPYKGCFVRSFDDRKIEQIFPIIGALEALAIRLAGLPAKKTLARLKALNARMSAPEMTGPDRYNLDRDFHLAVAGLAGNAVLTEEIARLLTLAGRFDAGAEKGLADLAGSSRHHEQMIQALEAGEKEAAAQLSERHWAAGIEVIRNWREAKDLRDPSSTT